MQLSLCVFGLTVLALQFSEVLSDTPGNCTYEEIKGAWTFSIGRNYSSYEELKRNEGDCSNFRPVKKARFLLQYPDLVTDELGNIGFWTLIYNQGFEVVVAHRKYFGFSRYEGTMDDPISICNETLPGFTHDVLQRQWACYRGFKQPGQKVCNKKTTTRPSVRDQALRFQPASSHVNKYRMQHTPYTPNQEFIDKINTVQSNWQAVHYPEYEEMTLAQLQMRQGGPASRHSFPPVSQPHPSLLKVNADLPESFDWRNVRGQNFVSPVRNQGGCGSCYSFSAAGMLEARIRVATNNALQPTLSPQDVVECSPYSQGCNGGFPYLIGGKYAEDFGFADESCNPYRGQDGKCSTRANCTRYYATQYRYVGGYYGACNEEVMKLALVHEGPLSVSFEVYGDFRSYRGGVYTHTGLVDRFNPFEITNHAVLLVGYGVDSASGMKYWIVKNSWGDSWGEQGYFRIRRGTNECSIESIAVSTQPVL